VSPYSIVGLSATWDVNKNLSTSGVDNLFDIRHYRAGNAQTTGNSTTGAYLYGAGAETYNESGRTFYEREYALLIIYQSKPGSELFRFFISDESGGGGYK
jgi:hypothetical protein